MKKLFILILSILIIPIATAFCGNGIVDFGETCDGENIINECYHYTGNTLGELGCYPPGHEYQCTDDISGCVNVCGNGIVEEGEVCDDGNRNNNDACTGYCQTATCGDGLVWNQEGGTEECDGLNMAGASCMTLQGVNEGTLICNACQIDDSDCHAECGNGYCETGETQGACIADCGIDGWNTVDDGWSINDEKRLVGKTGPDNTIMIYSNYFNIRLNSTYELSATIISSAGCTATIDLDDGKCLSGQDWNIKQCFNDVSITESASAILETAEFDVDNSSGFYKNVRLRITVNPGCLNGVRFDDVLIAEIPDFETYNDLPEEISSATSCCPINYCWDGNECIAPYTDSNTPPIWNSLNIQSLLPNNHVNTTDYWKTKGYRCIIDDEGVASWQPANLKYDWDFKNSGYCNSDTDCFVNEDFEYSLDSITRTDCIRDGEFIFKNIGETPADFGFGSGNHYCNKGTWTTKEYIIANFLENISDGKPYIIFCGSENETFNSPEQFNFKGGCVLILKEGGEERIITGFYGLESINPPNYPRPAICSILSNYKHLKDGEYEFGDGCVGDVSIPMDYSGCTPFPSTTNRIFERCLGNDAGTTAQPYLYINTEHQYYILSDKKIMEIEQGFFYTLWNSIIGFFEQLLGYEPTTQLGLAKQTTNYDKIYLLSNDPLSVSALQEKKYDEQVAFVMTYMYLNMTGENMDENKFNIEFINETLEGLYYEYNTSTTSQSLIIKYNNPTELWPYLTAMIRDR
ncbi:MAG: hypothetical protein ACP5NV_02090 [Candidatus Woesearchaeota archaeon]